MVEANIKAASAPEGQDSSLPSDWMPTRLRDLLAQDATYGIVKAGTFVRSGIPMLRGGDIKNGRIARDMPHVSEAKSEEFKRTILRDADVVIALVGYPGECAVVPPDLAGANISRAVGLLRPSKALSPDFLSCYLNSDSGRAEFLKPSAGSAQIVVNLKDLNNLTVPLPRDKVEQQAIAAALSDADALIEGLESLIAKKRAIKQGAMQELLTGRRRLPGFSGEWAEAAIGQLATIQRGASPRPIDSPLWFDENSQVGWVRISDVTSSGRFLDETVQKLSAAGIAKSRPVASGSLIMSICATVGRPIVTRIETCIHDGFVVFDDLCADQTFLFYALSRIEKEWSKHGQTGSQMNLNTGLINSTKIPLAQDRAEQAAIGAIFSDLDDELDALEGRLAKARDVKRGMMQELLAGRVRLV